MSFFVKRSLLVTFVMLISSLSFIAGYGLGQRPMVASASAAAPPITEVPDQFRVFWETWLWLDQEYFNKEALDPTKMTYGAIRGLLQSLGDTHTYFATPEEKEVNDTQLQGGFEGIGVTVEMRDDGKLRVVSPQDGTPGQKAGILPGDIVTHVGGNSIAGVTLIEAVTKIRGPKGTKVKLTIEREGQSAPLEFEVERAEIKAETVASKMLDNGVAYVRVSQFGQQTTRELNAALKNVQGQGATGLILDLRMNPGGYLVTAIEVTSMFLKDGSTVLHEVRGSGEQQEFKVRPGGIARDIKMVVLVDKGSASASEIVAGALQDYGRAKLVGDTTYGKGSVQNVHTLSDGSSLHVTIAHWLTPKQRPIDGQGLAPDVQVERPIEAAANGEDPQLDKAIETLLGGS